MKKLGLIILVAVMALGALGAAYAAWSQPLYVNGNVTNGTLKADFGYVVAPTDIAAVTAVVSDYHFTGDLLTITIANAYPGMDEYVYFQVGNIGTIPETVSVTSVSALPVWLGVAALAPSGPIAVGAWSGVGQGWVHIWAAGDNTSMPQGGTATFQVVLTAAQ
jgi:hypothetical protein